MIAFQIQQIESTRILQNWKIYLHLYMDIINYQNPFRSKIEFFILFDLLLLSLSIFESIAENE